MVTIVKLTSCIKFFREVRPIIVLISNLNDDQLHTKVLCYQKVRHDRESGYMDVENGMKYVFYKIRDIN